MKLLKDSQPFCEFPKEFYEYSGLIGQFISEFPDSTEYNIVDLPQDKAFTVESVTKILTFLEKYGKKITAPNKPLHIFVTFMDWVDAYFPEQEQEDYFKKDFLSDKFYDLVDLFNCALFLQINLIKDIVAAKLAEAIIKKRFPPERFLRQFGIIKDYQRFKDVTIEDRYIGREFVNKHDMEIPEDKALEKADK